jgi:hypothetical protein
MSRIKFSFATRSIGKKTIFQGSLKFKPVKQYQTRKVGINKSLGKVRRGNWAPLPKDNKTIRLSNSMSKWMLAKLLKDQNNCSPSIYFSLKYLLPI